MIVFKKFDLFNIPANVSEQIFVYRTQLNQELTPELPLVDEKVWELQWQTHILNNGFESYFYGIFDDLMLIGKLEFRFYKENTKNYIKNEKNVIFSIDLLKKYQRKGIGTQALKIMVDTCKKINKTFFISYHSYSSAISFFKAIGGEIARTSNFSKLDLDTVNWKMIDNWIIDAQKQNKDFKIQIFKEKMPDDYIEPFCAILNDTIAHEPRDAIDLTPPVIDPETIQRAEKTAKLNGEIYINAFCMTEQNEMCAISFVTINSSDKSFVHQGDTGVPIKYRGRKLGKWIKASMLLFLKENYPEIKVIVTNNAQSNGPMIYINEQLGFKKD